MTFNPSDHLTKLKGKDYLEAKWRLVWLRDEHPDAMIETQHIELSDEHAIFRAVVTFKEGGGASGYGSETKRDFGDYIEKAETKAIARALAAAGYGTQFTGDELAEGERIVDSPVQRSAPRSQPTPARTVNEASGTIAPGVGMTDQQRKAIFGIGKSKAMTREELEAVSQEMFGVELAALDKQQASKVIERLDGGGAEPHPKVQQAIDNREANWLAAIEGAATMGELQRIGAQIAEAGVKEGPLRVAYANRRDRLQEKALA